MSWRFSIKWLFFKEDHSWRKTSFEHTRGKLYFFTLSVTLSFFQTSPKTNCPKDLPSEGCLSEKTLLLFWKHHEQHRNFGEKAVEEILTPEKFYIFFASPFYWPLFLVWKFIFWMEYTLQKAVKVSLKCVKPIQTTYWEIFSQNLLKNLFRTLPSFLSSLYCYGELILIIICPIETNFILWKHFCKYFKN